MKKLPLILIVLIAVVTPLASTAFFYLWTPREQTNIGELLPAHPAPLAEWRAADGTPTTAAHWAGQWLLLTAMPQTDAGGCDAFCQQQLCRIHTLRLILPGAYVRLQPLWLLPRGALSGSPPDKIFYASDCGEGGEQLQTRVREIDVRAGVATVYGALQTLPAGHTPGAIYLIDPDKNWVLRFAPNLPISAIRKDVSKLMRLSKGRKFFQS